jgi:uncharacterized protein YjbJ (UPF0337 family)
MAICAEKENFGWAVGNKQMEAEGLARKEKGNAELEAAKAEQRHRQQGAGQGQHPEGRFLKFCGGKDIIYFQFTTSRWKTHTRRRW